MIRARLLILPLVALLAVAGAAEPDQAGQVLTLTDALRLAHTQGRDKQFQDEELRLLEQQYRNTRWDYAPQPHGSLAATTVGTVEQGRTGDTASADLGVGQSLPTGGSLDVATTTVRTRTDGLGTGSATALTASLHQPLLRGAGYAVWSERLTSAQRSYLYAVRAHELFRQDLTLGIARTFWGLQQQKNNQVQAEAAVTRAEFLYQQTEALMSIGKSNANDVFRARIAMLGARQAALDAKAAFEAAVDAFKVDLNLPVETAVRIDDTPPPAPLLEIDAAKAIASAFARRLDWKTALDTVADAQRAVPLARRALLPDLGLDASLGYHGVAGRPWSDTLEDDPAYSVGVSLEIPFNRRNERLAYDRALVGEVRARRALEEQRQRVINQVLDDIRELRRADTTREIQGQNRIQSRSRLEKAQIDLKAGLIGNRDLVEAQNDVLAAETAYFASVISYRSSELRLRRDTGVLVIAEDGSWVEQWPDYLSLKDEPR
jgi:outer membrane protein TolC